MGEFTIFRDAATFFDKVASEAAIDTLKNFKFENEIIDQAFSKAKTGIEFDSGFLKIGETPVSEFHLNLHSADLEGALKDLNSPANVTELEKSSFSKSVEINPDKEYKSLQDDITRNKKTNGDLAVSDDSKMSQATKEKVSKIEKRLKTGAKYALVIGGIVIGAGWLKNSVAKRNGCWMVSTINGQTTSCKVSSYSCASPNESDPCKEMAYTNSVLQLMAVSQLPDANEVKIKYLKDSGLEAADLKAGSIGALLTDKDKSEKYLKGVKAMDAPLSVDVCKISDSSIEGGVIPPCRMCDIGAPPTATTFIDPTQFASNISFKCVTNSTYLDVITDVAKSTGINLLDNTSSISGSLGSIIRWSAIIIVIIVILIIAFRIIGLVGGKRN